MLDPDRKLFAASGEYGRPNCVATIKDDRVILHGQKAAWCSNTPAAELCVLYVAADTGAGPDPRHGACLIVPLDLPGVQKGKVIAKMGQRALPQGEIFFDQVELPLANILAGPADYQRAVYAIHAEANGLMGAVWTGAARAAYELAFDYAHERKQGGLPDHPPPVGRAAPVPHGAQGRDEPRADPARRRVQRHRAHALAGFGDDGQSDGNADRVRGGIGCLADLRRQWRYR